MEQQNINLINKHKPELLKQIKVNQVLLGHFSSDVLGVSDIEEVDSKVFVIFSYISFLEMRANL